MLRVAIVLIAIVAVAACDLPRDADHTLDRIRGGTMRVGIIHDPPWLIDDGSRVGGVEGELLQALAAELGARIDWVRQSSPKLLTALHDRKIDVVAGGLVASLPWKQEVAFTRPYRKDAEEHVFALPPGENAWLVHVEQFLHQHGQ